MRSYPTYRETHGYDYEVAFFSFSVLVVVSRSRNSRTEPSIMLFSASFAL